MEAALGRDVMKREGRDDCLGFAFLQSLVCSVVLPPLILLSCSSIYLGYPNVNVSVRNKNKVEPTQAHSERLLPSLPLFAFYACGGSRVCNGHVRVKKFPKILSR